MPLRFRTIVCTVVVAAIGVACQPPMTHIEVQVIPYPGANLARLPCEEFVLLKTEDPVPAGCVQTADVYLGDTGETSWCEDWELEDQLKETACAAGYDLGRILYVRTPGDDSPCYQMRVGLLECEAGKTEDES